ncbi:unnamed protein product [Phytophthora fragariaefolia]|uniref:Unnamed protein product n=1 Tax=Phytophthora fragariaefolia TaxID=1490495 RepID=A0A9W6U2Q4_9STRA|nr:unnamed protein product [Phytophthora fragariaefolia]
MNGYDYFVVTVVFAQKPRIQRLLPVPGKNIVHDSASLSQSAPATLVRLPDSPPRLLSVGSMDTLGTAKTAGYTRGTGPITTNVEFTLAALAISDSILKKDATVCGSIFSFQTGNGITTNHPKPSQNLITEGCYKLISNNINQDCSTPLESDSCDDQLSPRQKEQTEECQQVEENCRGAETIGPLLTDIQTEIAVESAETNQENYQAKDRADREIDGDGYEQAIANRKLLLNNEANRQRIREELELYVDSLSSRTDENGEHLVEFPRNYQQIVSLMTQKDVVEEANESQEESNSHRTWFRVLIEAGLSKQQAFDTDDDPEGSSSLATKIALKMARIRQLDAVLEEKLGKNLYASTAPRKQKRVQPPPQLNASRSHSCGLSRRTPPNRTFVTQTQPCGVASNGIHNDIITRESIHVANEDEVVPGNKKGKYFIERNKQMVANGMKANMTKDEEDRLEKLLRDEVTSSGAVSDDPATSDNVIANVNALPEEWNEFSMAETEKQAIDELIAAKSGAYPLFAIDELHDGPTDDALHLPDTRPAKNSIIQETKRERLQRQRLSRVEQELRFLQESPGVVIVGDDHDGDENDDCLSEQSFITVASSTCSTRSGVISRHDFKCFLAQQKESYLSTPTASADEIRRLLLSISSGAAASNTMTAMTG